MKLYKFGWPFRLLYPSYTWRRRSSEKVIYLTFDDGPIPEVTEYVLDLLKKYQVKATFFCVGENIKKHPEVYERLLSEGHKTGNHTYNHLKGFDTNDEDYLNNVQLCDDVMKEQQGRKLFRPPYGKIKRSQAKKLQHDYEIVMWEVLSNDFMKSVTSEECLKKSIAKTSKGSIVLFHDSVKTSSKIQYVLPRYLEHFIKKGFRFELL